MADTGEIDPTELAGEIVERALDSEPVRNLLGPLTKNIGLILGKSATSLAFTRNRISRAFSRSGESIEKEDL